MTTMTAPTEMAAMTHPDTPNLLWMALAGLAGVLIGVAFFAGLWWSVRRGLASSSPGLWMLGSLLVRLTLALAGFYWVGGGDWQRLLACLAGFLLGRWAVVRWSGGALSSPRHAAAPQIGHATPTPPQKEPHAAEP